MATVFSIEAVAGNQVPYEGDQLVAAELVVARMGELAVSYGGSADILIYGSTGKRLEPGQVPNIRSDVDVIVVTDTLLNDLRLDTFGAALADIHAETHVPLDVRLLTPAEVADSKGNAIGDPLFVEHLRLAQQTSRFRHGDATQGLRSITDYPRIDQVAVAADITRGYLIHKTDRVLEAERRPDLDVRDIQRGLGLARSLGYKLGRVLQLADHIEGDVSNLLTRDDAEALYAPLSREDRRFRAAGELVRLDAEYDYMLHEALDGNISVGAYRAWLLDCRERIFRHSRHLLIAARVLLQREFY